MEPKDGGLVQMIFLFNLVIFWFHVNPQESTFNESEKISDSLKGKPKKNMMPNSC